MNSTHAAGCVAFGLAWLWFDDYRPWFKSHSEAWAMLALLCWWGRTLVQAGGLLLPTLVPVALVPLVFATLQYGLGQLPFMGDVAIAAVYSGGLAAAIGLGWHWRLNAPLLARSVVCVLILAALGNVAIGWLQWLQLQESFGMFVMQGDVLGDTARGNLGQSNHLATLSVLGVLACVAAYEARVMGLVGLTCAALFLGSGVVLSNSRTGLLNVLLASGLLLWLRRPTGMRLPKGAMLAWPAACVAGAAALPTVSELLFIRSIDFARAESMGDRWMMWRQCLEAIIQRPWAGYGFEHMAAAQAVGAPAHHGVKELTYTHAHNLALDLAVWFGLPGALAVLALLAWWGWSRLQTVATTGSALAMAGLAAIGLHSMLEFPFAYLYFLVAAGLMAGWIEAGHWSDARASSIPPLVLPRWIGLVCLAVSAGLSGIFLRDYALAEEDFRVVRFENLRVGETPADYEAPRMWVLDQLGALLAGARLKLVAGVAQEDLEVLRTATQRFAYGSLRFRYVRALALSGDLVEARRQLGLIRAIHGAFFHNACLEQLRELAGGGQPALAALLPTAEP
jgi:O-antigen ligase